MNNDIDLDIYLVSLMNSLIIDNEISDNYNEILENISLLLSDNPKLFDIINKSKFFSSNLLRCLRNDESFNESLEFLSTNLNNLNLPDLYFTKKFIFFITDKLYEKMYQNYEYILDFIDVFVGKYKFTINLLYECGFFCLLNGIIDTKTCKIYNTIFKGVISSTKSSKEDLVSNKDCFYEIQRKQFDSEIIFNENNLIKFKKFSFFKEGSSYHEKIYENLVNTSLYNLIMCDFKEMDNVINYKKNEYEFLYENNELIEGCFEKKLTYLRIIRIHFYNYKEMVDIGFLKKISKFLTDKLFSVRYEVLLILSLQQEMYIRFNENKIRCIFQILEYEITECIKCEEEKCDGECTLLSILDFLHKIYTSGNKLFFYKISFLILLREISKKIGHIFIAEYFKDIVEYFKIERNNISRILFPYQPKRGSAPEIKLDFSNIKNKENFSEIELEDENLSEIEWEDENLIK
ncbi:uncharacterized protein VNE69_06032 [Vairimorpha necatrix]|uniref:Uncharacterized protein n=1 Tax=Vairimorpha necatrix TaxID=6039 RepID=A0AAX4JCN3_9MICR